MPAAFARGGPRRSPREFALGEAARRDWLLPVGSKLLPVPRVLSAAPLTLTLSPRGGRGDKSPILPPARELRSPRPADQVPSPRGGRGDKIGHALPRGVGLRSPRPAKRGEG